MYLRNVKDKASHGEEWRRCAAIAVTAAVLASCSPINAPQPKKTPDESILRDFPSFFTSNDDYFTNWAGSVQFVDPNEYRLDVSGLVRHPRSFTLAELRRLPLDTLPLTVECIGNSSEGPLAATAQWRGFRLYDLLLSLGLDSSATGVTYQCADGYYASHTMDQIKNNGVMGALFMNGDTIPPLQGYPLRMLVPGYYGVKQPMWVVAMKVTDQPLTDYWSDRGWDVSPPIPINSKIFFPLPGTTYKTGDTVRIGGCAYGGKRAETVEITNDEGASWQKADIVKSIDADDVWVFWLAQLIAPQPGTLVIQVRATDIHGAAQPRTDTDGLNGTNSWPALSVSVIADSAR